MPTISRALETIAAARKGDPLAPVTVIVPSHVAGLQLRRRLALLGPFAAVRFETLPRIAEILGAADLAATGRLPLARPIADYIAEQVARESGDVLARVADLAGYGRALRQIFRRLRRGGITRSDLIAVEPDDRYFGEIVRLYGRFRDLTARFYDEEDLLDAAATAVREGRAGALPDLGAFYVVPPAAQSAGAATLLGALRRATPAFTVADDAKANPRTRLVLAPDPTSEAREVAREVLAALDEGLGLHEIAVFHGTDSSYPRLLREALARADIPAAPMPGIPLIETATGRGVFALASLPEDGFSRAAVLDFLSIAPVRARLPAGGGTVPVLTATWDRLSRAAGVTHGKQRWRTGTAMLIEDREAELAAATGDADEARNEARRSEVAHLRELQGFVETLIDRLEPLSEPQSATSFIAAFKAVVRDYLTPDAAALDKVQAEIDQLGTVGAVSGSFSLTSFTRALRANLETAVQREHGFGEGVLIADYRSAAGLEFTKVILAGAYEGALPAAAGSDGLIEDRVWQRLRAKYPYVEDKALRLERAGAAAGRAIASASGTLVWTAPLNEAGGNREYYPSPVMVAAAARLEPAIATASDLRRAAGAGWLRRPRSPLAAMLAGPAVDAGEVNVRDALLKKRQDLPIGPGHPLRPALVLLRSRRSSRFTEWDGNLAGLDHPGWLALTSIVSPTSLENYAACGFRYFCRSLLRLNVVQEPEDQETMEPAERGTLIHEVLEAFFREQRGRGRPASGEAWTAADTRRLLAIFDDRLAKASDRGKTGLDLYASHEARHIRADLTAFLEYDTEFRRETGALPAQFEVAIPEVEVAGVRLRGIADRVDQTSDGRAAWVIDYKTGSSREFQGLTNDDPLLGGTKLQLPVYLAAVQGVETQTALYWFISRRAEFKRFEYLPTAQNQERFEETLKAIVAGIAAGAFPAVSGNEDEHYGGFANCRYCDFDRICSRRRDYEQQAKSEDVGLAPWQRVASAARGGGGP